VFLIIQRLIPLRVLSPFPDTTIPHPHHCLDLPLANILSLTPNRPLSIDLPAAVRFALLCTHLCLPRPLDNGILRPGSERIHHFNDKRNEGLTGRVWDGEALEVSWIEVQETTSSVTPGDDNYNKDLVAHNVE